MTVITSTFVTLAKTCAEGHKVGDMPFAVVEHPMGGIPPEDVRAKADRAIEDIIYKATQWVPQKKSLEMKKAYPAATVSAVDTIEEVNDLFYKNAWTDGLPIIPPTRQRVENMLTGTSLKPDHLVGLIPPRMGSVTVQVIAINAVMAGAKPEHLPVIIAAVKAALEPEVDLRRWFTTTLPNFISIFVQGPIVKELGIHYGQSALLPGPKPNAPIGRAFSLTTRLAGGIISSGEKIGTMSTLGIPIYSSCLGENEEGLPKGWNPLRVDSGYKLEESAVSVFAAPWPLFQNDHDSNTGRDVLLSTCYRIGGHLIRFGGHRGGIVILFGPEHAATIARDGYSKEDVKQFIYDNAKIPREWLLKGGSWNIVREEQSEWIKKAVADGVPMIHHFNSPEQITISVAGGAGKQSLLGIGCKNPPPTIIEGATRAKAGH